MCMNNHGVSVATYRNKLAGHIDFKIGTKIGEISCMVNTYERRVLATDYTAVYKFCTNASFDLKRSETGGLWIDAGCRNHASTRGFSITLWVLATC